MAALKCVKCKQMIPESLRIDQLVCPNCKTVYKPVKGKWWSPLGRATLWKESK